MDKAAQIKQELNGAENWNVIVKTKKDISQQLMDFVKKIDFAKFENVIHNSLQSLNIKDAQKFSLKIMSDKVALIVNKGPVTLLIHYINDNGTIINKLDSIRVEEKYQKKGIGSAITKYLMSSAHAMGVSKVIFFADKAGGYAWASLANAKNKNCIMNISDERALKIIEGYYGKEGHNEEEPFPMCKLLNKEWSMEVLSQSSWFAEITF